VPQKFSEGIKMAKEDYGENTLIGRYIRICDARGLAVTEGHLNALEKAVMWASGIKEKGRELSESDRKPISLDELRETARKLGHTQHCATHIMRIAQEKGIGNGEALTNEEMLKLYKSFEGAAAEDRRKYDPFKTGLYHFGWKSYRLLKEYLENQGLVPEDPI